MGNEILVGRWVKCSERSPSQSGIHIVRETERWLLNGQVFSAICGWDGTPPLYWLEPFDPASDEAFVGALTEAIDGAWKPNWPNSRAIAKAALGAAMRGEATP